MAKGQGPQKADHGGNFIMTPRRVLNSKAWRDTSYRARSILQVFQYAFDGYNNGSLSFGIHDIGKAIGNQNHGANAKAVAELIEKGFLECTSDADHKLSKVRQYRITFVSTGQPRDIVPATHDYESWRPVHKRKFGGARTATQNPVSGVVTTTNVQLSGAETATHTTENCGSCTPTLGAETTPILLNHSKGPEPDAAILNQSLKSNPEMLGADLLPELTTLRDWTCKVIELHGYGGARKLAEDAGIPEPTLSRFRSGKSLPDHCRVPLQMACGRTLPFSDALEASQ